MKSSSLYREFIKSKIEELREVFDQIFNPDKKERKLSFCFLAKIGPSNLISKSPLEIMTFLDTKKNKQCFTCDVIL